MAKIYAKSHREPFDVSYELAEKIKRDWMNDEVPRTTKISFSFFVGTLGDIKSFDMRTEREIVDKYPDWSPLTLGEQAFVRKKSTELGGIVREIVDRKTEEQNARRKLEADRLKLLNG